METAERSEKHTELLREYIQTTTYQRVNGRSLKPHDLQGCGGQFLPMQRNMVKGVTRGIPTSEIERNKREVNENSQEPGDAEQYFGEVEDFTRIFQKKQ